MKEGEGRHGVVKNIMGYLRFILEWGMIRNWRSVTPGIGKSIRGIQKWMREEENESAIHHTWKNYAQEGKSRMANEELLQLIKQGIDVWNRWRDEETDLGNEYPEMEIDLREVRKADFREVWFSQSSIASE